MNDAKFAKLEACGVDIHKKSTTRIIEEHFKQIDKLQQQKKTAMANQQDDIQKEIEDKKKAIREIQAIKVEKKQPQSRHTITEWSKKSQIKHLELANEISDMAELGMITPSRCMSVSLIPDRCPEDICPTEWAKKVKNQISRFAEYVQRKEAILLGVIESFATDSTCPHFHAFIFAPNGSLSDLEQKFRNKWQLWHPVHKRAVVKPLTAPNDVKRVLFYPHNPVKKQIRDKLGNIGNRVVSAGLKYLPTLQTDLAEIDPLIYLG